MRNLFHFLVKNYFTLLFLLLLGISLALSIQFNNYHKANFLTSLQSVSGNAYNLATNFKSYLTLHEVNKRLARENAFLRNQSKLSYYSVANNHVFFDDSLHQKRYKFVEAQVVNSSQNKAKNYITINRGYAHGIKSESAVINGDGVVGIVKDVSKNFSTIISLLHVDASVSAKLKKSGYYGLVNWNSKDISTAQLIDIPNHVEVEIGDTVVTRGFNSAFPANIPIGLVKHASIVEGDPFYLIDIKLTAGFKKLDFVYVVEDILSTEIKELENLSQE